MGLVQMGLEDLFIFVFYFLRFFVFCLCVFIFFVFLAFLLFSCVQAQVTATCREHGEFHSNLACSDPVRNFPTSSELSERSTLHLASDKSPFPWKGFGRSGCQFGLFISLAEVLKRQKRPPETKEEIEKDIERPEGPNIASI